MKAQPVNGTIIVELKMKDGKLSEYQGSEHSIQNGIVLALDADETYPFKVGDHVFWEKFAERGNTWDEDGKKYAAIPRHLVLVIKQKAGK